VRALRSCFTLLLTPELAVAGAIVGGWICVTVAVAQLAPPGIVWPASMGLLLLSLAGWKFIGHLAWYGLYVLSHDEPKGRGR
jgi:hypothetical protein